MVRLRPPDGADILSRTQHGLLDSVAAGFWLRERRNRDQHHCHDPVHALQGNDAWKDAALGLAESHNGRSGRSAVSPLTAAQLMLLVDRYLGGHFFDTQAGGSAVIWMHFFWVFGHPEVYVLV